MDDATLNPEADGSQPPDVQLQAIVNRLSRRLGESAETPVPLDGGITNRNFRARFGGAEYVIRIPGKDTSLLEIDRGAELIANERAAECGIAPEVAAMLDDPQCIVTEFIEGEGLSSEQLREAGRARRGGALAARLPRSRAAAAARASTPSGSSRPTPRPRPIAARPCPTPTPKRTRVRPRSRRL